MKIKVERCWGGNDNHYVRTTMPDGTRAQFKYHYGEESWTRALASEILDYYEYHYGINRKSIRFDHLN